MSRYLAIETRRKDLRELSFRCERCGYRGLAKVLVEGRGYARARGGLAGGFPGAERARDQAEDAAQEAVEENARTARGLVPCPRCGLRDPTEVASFKLKLAGGVVGYGALGGVLWVMFDALTGIGVGGGFAAWFVWRQADAWLGAARRVTFVKPSRTPSGPL